METKTTTVVGRGVLIKQIRIDSEKDELNCYIAKLFSLVKFLLSGIFLHFQLGLFFLSV